MPDLLDILDGYTHRNLPDLGSGQRDPSHEPISSKSAVNIIEGPSTLKPKVLHAFASLLLQYIDTQDLLIEISPGALVRAPTHLAPVAYTSQDAVRAALGVDATTLLFPVAFAWGFFEFAWRPKTFKLLVTYAESERSLKLHLQSDTFLINPASAALFLSQLIHLVAPTSPTPPLHLLSVAEASYDPSQAHVVPEWLIKIARAHPESPAHEIYAQGELWDIKPEVLTYGELNARSNALARWLLESGLVSKDEGEQARICVCRTRDAWFYVLQAAIWKAGACYVAIDPDLPPARKAYIVLDSACTVVFTTATEAAIFAFEFDAHPDGAQEQNIPLFVVPEQDLQDTRQNEGGEDICLARLDGLAYLLYTSGTTGTPKGCLLTHRGLYWAIDAMCAYPRPVTQPDVDKRLALASIAFDVHISEIAQAWALGIALLSAPRMALLADLPRVLREKRVTHMGIVPSMLRACVPGGPEDLLVDDDGAEGGRRCVLKYLVSGGEKASDEVLAQWAGREDVVLANFYGPTEATVGCSSRIILPSSRKENIGRAFSACCAYIAVPAPTSTTTPFLSIPDEGVPLAIAPRGTPGELIVAGPLVGVGYQGLPEATKKAFLEWPEKGCRAYRTGDLVRMMPDGTLEILGRIDTQIKLRGVRIEAEGVSAVLRSASTLELDATTLVSTHPSLGTSEVLVSFLAPASKSARVGLRPELCHNGEMRAVVRGAREKAVKELASYMRPAYVVPVTALPLSMNGKADGKALGELFRETELGMLLALQGDGPVLVEKAQGDGEETMVEQEREVFRALKEVLGEDVQMAMGPRTNLFECGLDSLGFVRLARLLGRDVQVHDIMAHPTIKSVAELVDAAKAEPALEKTKTTTKEGRERWNARASAVFEPAAVEQVLPPFPVQEGVLASIVAAGTDTALYVQHFAYRVAEGVDAVRLRKAWEVVVGRQEILRTVFVVDDEGLLQVVLKPDAVELPWREHSIQATEDVEAFVDQIESTIASDINQDITVPLFRLNVYKSDRRAILVLSMSHTLYDALAIPPLMREVDALLVAREHPLPPSVPLAAVLAHLPALDDPAVRGFWTSAFEGIVLPVRTVRKPTDGVAARTHRILEVSYEEAKEACARMRVTQQALFTAAFALAGRSVCGWTRDAVFGVVRSGRSIALECADEAICPLVSVVPTPVRLASRDGDTDAQSVVRATQEFIYGSLPFEHMPLGRVQRWLGRNELVEVLFSCRYEEAGMKGGYEAFEHVFSGHPAPEFILAVEVLIDAIADAVDVRVAFTESDVSKDEVEGLLKDIEAVVDSLVHGTHHPGLLVPGDIQDGSFVRTSNGQAEIEVDPEVIDTLATHIAAFLRIDKSTVKPSTSFSALGLSSLQTVSLAKVIGDAGLAVSPVDIMQADSMKRLAAKVNVKAEVDQTEVEAWLKDLKGKLAEEIKLKDVRLDEMDEVVVVPCTALQSGMLSQTINSGGELYVHAFTFQLRKICDVNKLKLAWLRAVRHLNILRTSFHFAAGSGRWVQALHSVEDFKWSEEKRESVRDAAVEFISTLSFGREEDVARPPVHLRHISTAEQEYLVLVMHHALYDGIAIPMLLQHVRRSYDEQPQGQAVGFDQLVDAILRQEYAGTDYWCRVLKDVEPWRFPRRSDGGAVDAWRSSVVLDMPKEDVARTCRRYRVHPQCLGQAAWAKVLASASRSADIVFGQVVAGRVLPGAKDFVGPVFNTIPCRLTIARGQTNKSLIQQAHRSNVDALSWQHASLRTIQRTLGVQHLCDTLFLFQPGTDEGESEGGDALWDILGRADVEHSKTQYAVNVELHESSEGYRVFASCSTDVMDLKTFQSLLADFEKAFMDVVRSPNAPALPNEFNFNLSFTGSSTEGIQEVVSSDAVADERVRASWGPQEQRLFDILVDFAMLPASSVKPSTHLVSMGVDSISAIQIAAMARKAGVSVVAADIVRCTSVADLMTALSRKDVGPASPSTPTAGLPEEIAEYVRQSLPMDVRGRVESVLPTSPGMDWYIASWQRSKGRRWQYAFAFRSSSTLDAAKLRRAWSVLVKNSPILRSTFAPTGDEDRRIALCVLRDWEPTFWEEKVPEYQDDLSFVHEQARRFVRTPPTEYVPFSRLAIVHGQKSSYVVLGLHHMQYDAWSLRLLVENLACIYQDMSPAANTDLRRFLGNFTRDEVTLEAQRKYWQSMFEKPYQPSLFPALNSSTSPNPSTMARTNRIVREGFPPLSTLQEKGRADGLTLSAVLLACWARVQARWTKASDVAFGTMLANRGEDYRTADGKVQSVDNLAVPTLNVLPHRVAEADAGVCEIGKVLMEQMRARTDVVGKSRMTDVCAWIGRRREPICNVFINVLRAQERTYVGGEEQGDGRLLEPVKLPYRVPNPNKNAVVKSEDGLSGTITAILRKFGIFSRPETNVVDSSAHALGEAFRDVAIPEIIDEVSLEFIYNTEKDTLVMAVECDERMMSDEQADELAEEWAAELREYVVPVVGKPA